MCISEAEFDSSKVTESDDDDDTTGLFTGMANVDWLLLSAYHLKRAGYKSKASVQLLKGVAAFSLLCPMTSQSRRPCEGVACVQEDP